MNCRLFFILMFVSLVLGFFATCHQHTLQTISVRLWHCIATYNPMSNTDVLHDFDVVLAFFLSHLQNIYAVRRSLLAS